jgi:hypothetical protein
MLVRYWRRVLPVLCWFHPLYVPMQAVVYEYLSSSTQFCNLHRRCHYGHLVIAMRYPLIEVSGQIVHNDSVGFYACFFIILKWMVKQGQYISSLECNHQSSHQIRVHLIESIDPVIERKNAKG